MSRDPRKRATRIGRITMILDAEQPRKVIERFARRALALPEDARSRIADNFIQLVRGGGFLKITQQRGSSARDAGALAIRLRIVRVRELLTAALRAAQGDSLGFHNGAPVVAEVGRASKANTGCLVS